MCRPSLAHLRLHDPSHSGRPCSLKGPWTCYLPWPASPVCQSHFSFLALLNTPSSSFLQPLPYRTCRCIEIIGLYSEWPGCQCGFRIEIFSLGATSSLWPPFQASFLCLPPRPRPITALTPTYLEAQWRNIHGTLSAVAQLAQSFMYGPFFLWRCCLADLLGSRLLNVAYIQNLQPQGAFIPLAKFNRFLLIPFPLPLSPSFSLSHSVSLLSYSEFNEGEEIKGSLWFYGLLRMMERLAFFVSAEWATQRAFMWNEIFLSFFFSPLGVGKVIEMSEKEEPGSLEQKGSIQCQGSSPNIPWFFFLFFFFF